jgi:hypothetical protein
MAHYFIANHQKRFVAIASPKCASRSVRRWFLATIGEGAADLRACDPYLVGPRQLADLEDYERVLFVRDPLRRLVGFYWEWVVSNATPWSFVGDDGDLPLEHASFRQMIGAIETLRREGRTRQHHLLEQVARLPRDRPPDHLALVERLDDELVALNERFGVVGVGDPDSRGRAVDLSLTEPVMDHPPEWFRGRASPRSELFYDPELAACARRCYPADVALHASIPGARPLDV